MILTLVMLSAPMTASADDLEDAQSGLDKITKQITETFEKVEKVAKKMNAMYKKHGNQFDKVIVKLGLTGGTNTVAIKKVVKPGTIKVKNGVATVTLPLVSAEAKCKRSGYRVIQLGAHKGKPKKTVVTADVLPQTTSKDWGGWLNAVKKIAIAMCKTPKPPKVVPLPVLLTTQGACGKAPGKVVVGKKQYKMTAKAVPHTFTLVCE